MVVLTVLAVSLVGRRPARRARPGRRARAGAAAVGAVRPAPPLLCARGLRVAAPGPEGPVTLVDRVSLDLRAGETLGLVGESGSGKSLTALSLIDLVPGPARLVEGSVTLEGRELLGLGPDAIAGGARGAHRPGAAGLVGGPGPRAPGRLAGGRDPARARAAGAPRGPAPGRGGPGRGGGHARRPPAPALGRPAPAGDDRDGPRPRAGGPARRRAHLGPRRADAGAGAGPHRPAPPGDGPGRAPHLPRRGRGGAALATAWP